MSRFQSYEEIYSALYVDFDNIYSRLADQDPGLARTFAVNPQRWMRWLEGHAVRIMYGEGVRRRILKRCCYLNPHKYQDFRAFFIRSAFQVVDCPPLTSQGKTSADILLVMDCMDALNHVTRFDEIIILSGDADFTPLLLRIQEHARRTLVLSVGYTSPAYVAACTWRIREDWFVTQALEESRSDDLDKEDDFSGGKGNSGRSSSPTDVTRQPVGDVSLPTSKRMRVIEAIKQVVVESSVPVPLPSIAVVLQQEIECTPDWFGAGTLKDLLELLDISPILLSDCAQGYVYDPERHIPPVGSGQPDDFRQRAPELYEFAMKVHRLTDLPLLSPGHYKKLLSCLVDTVKSQGFARAETLRIIEDCCEDEGIPVTPSQIGFVLEACIRGGLPLSASPGKRITVNAAQKAFLNRAKELCKFSQLPLDEKAEQMLTQWLTT